MTRPSERFARVEALFHVAAALPAGEREAFLAQNESDPELRAEVARLLARDDDRNATFDAALAGAMSVPTHARQIGAYRVLGVLGSGGMGTVLLAEREFGDTRQKVALKLISGFPTADARGRLARERSLLAGLNHPNIAALLDAGETADGVPYLVMEYVEGLPLHEYCAKHALDLRARLRLFAQLCRAVQHAHQRLVVHRDIKPGNILVRDDGTPVLLDFGIGKLLDATGRDATSTRVYTPAYAAPEQVAGGTVTTAADIYGLGCVLHELLTGRSVHEALRDGRLMPPSRIARSGARALRGDLDTIVAKAVHTEPERRFASAQALADDIENHLAGRPLRAVPDSAAYRLRKFVARHRFGVAAALAIAVLAVAFVWRVTAERARALAAEARAERQAASARRSRDFLVSLFEAAAPGNASGRAPSARDLIDLGNAKAQDELAGEPETAARIGATVTDVYVALGDPKAAVASGERALALVPGDTREHGVQRADVLVTLASAYDATERFDDARRAGDEALALRERFAPEDRAGLATTLNELGASALRRGDLRAARALFERSIGELGKVSPADPVARSGVLRGLAEIDVNEGRFDQALRQGTEAVRLLEVLPPAAPERLDAWRVLARVQVARHDADGAVATLERALAAARPVLGTRSMKVADIENDLGVALNGFGRYREAIAHLQNSIAISTALRPGDKAATGFDRMNLGGVEENLGDYAAAETLMRGAIADMEAATPDEPQLDFFRGNLARTLTLRGKIAQARALSDRALAGIAAREGASGFNYAFQLFRRARIELAAGDPAAADKALRESVRIADPLLPSPHALRVQFAAVRGMIAQANGDLAVAQREFEAAQAMQATLVNDDPVSLAILRMRLAGVLLARGDAASAKAKLDAAQPLLEKTLLPQAAEMVEVRRIRAELSKRDAR